MNRVKFSKGAIISILMVIIITSFCACHDYTKEAISSEQTIMSYSDCKDISQMIENAIEHDPDTKVTVLSISGKIRVSCSIDPIILGYQVVPIANAAIPIVKEYLLDKNIPFELDISGKFYKNAEVSSIIRIGTEDLELWHIDDLSDPDHVFLKKDITFQEICDHLNK